MSEKDYTNVILEEIRSQYQAITELVQDVPQMKQDLSEIKADVSIIKDDIHSIKVIVKDHETRITTLEAGPKLA